MADKKTKIISSRLDSLKGTESFMEYLNKKVFSKSGEYIGRVRDVISYSDKIAGAVINGKYNYFIDEKYFESDSKKALVLSINPVFSLIGKKVYDSQGRKIGKVIGIKRDTTANKFKALIVKKHFFLKPFFIPKGDIEVSKKNIILKFEYE
jgi:sporulation protein YlmC with PRC-barrel domain